MKRIEKQFALVFMIMLMSLFMFSGMSWAAESNGNYHWIQEGKDWYYRDLNTGTNLTDDWLLYNGYWYYLREDGRMAVNANLYDIDTGKTYWLGLDGRMLANGWKESCGVWNYYGADGSLFKNGVTPDGYTVDMDGRWIEEIAQKNVIRTWDKINFPDIYGPTEWPYDIPESDDYIEKNINNTLKIAKYYQFADAEGNVYSLDYFATTCTPHRVYIMDEVEGNGFKLTDWFESKDDWQPPADGDPDDYSYEQVKKQHFNTGITGTEERLPHVIPPESDTKVLHILLEYVGKPEL